MTTSRFTICDVLCASYFLSVQRPRYSCTVEAASGGVCVTFEFHDSWLTLVSAVVHCLEIIILILVSSKHTQHNYHFMFNYTESIGIHAE